MRRVLPLAAVLSGLLVPATAPAQTKIQPGASMGGCTMNFIFDGLGPNAGKVYFGSAAHCVDTVGEEVEDGDGNTVGRVAFIDNAAAAATDYAFVEVLADQLDRVDPAMKGHPEYPTGVTVAEDTTPGDAIQLSGYGVGFGETQPTQEERQAALVSDDAEIYQFDGPSVNGDSGGPLVHVPTGKALGIVSRYGLPLLDGVIVPSTDVGPTMQGILDKAAARNFSVRLRLAGESAPAPAAEQPAPPPASPPPAQAAPQPQSQPEPRKKAKSTRAARKAAALKRCRKAAKRIKSAPKRRKALRRCARAARR